MRNWDLDVERMPREKLEAHYFDAVSYIEDLVPCFNYSEGGLLYFKHGLTRSEIDALETLRVGRVFPYSVLGVRISQSDTTENPEGSAKVIVHRLRKKLLPLGIKIKAVRGKGVFMDEASIAKLKQLIAEHQSNQRGK